MAKTQKIFVVQSDIVGTIIGCYANRSAAEDQVAELKKQDDPEYPDIYLISEEVLFLD